MIERPVIERRNGTRWRLSEPQRTSDGFLVATGFLLDPDTGEDALDEDGFPITHSFFLGKGCSFFLGRG